MIKTSHFPTGCFFSAQGGTRTHKELPPTDFKSVMYANSITWATNNFQIEAMVGFAPTNNGFADRRVSYFTTWP